MHHVVAHIAIPIVAAFVLFFVLLLSFLAYLIPTGIAWYRGHRNKVLITVLNVLFGWSLIGWVVCALWAIFGDKRDVCTCGDPSHPCGLKS
jgi:hypothetical protein